jgi:hypothetical protein
VNNILASTNLNKATTKNVKKHKNRRQNLQWPQKNKNKHLPIYQPNKLEE